MTSTEKKGLTGEDIDENMAKEIAEEFIGKDKIKEISKFRTIRKCNNSSIYFFNNRHNDENINISISQKGGHVIYMNIQ